MDTSIEEKYDKLKKIIVEAGSAVVAFSGGVDSTFLVKVCSDTLGEKALAVTARSATFPKRELEEAKDLATRFGCRHMIIDSNELEIQGFSDNPPNRCFYCKNELFSKIKTIAQQQDIQWVFDGNNADDRADFRPGRAAARQLGVRSPLEEAGLTKQEIRDLSWEMGLPTWDKPAFACLSSRFPYHTKITPPALRQVEEAEDYLWRLGMRAVRVRHHGDIARIELGEREMKLIWERGLGKQISRHLKTLGFKYVSLDLEGYRTGSMNETLSKQQMAAEYDDEGNETGEGKSQL